DQVRIYNTALSASDVSSLYNSDNAPPADTTPPTVPTGLTTTPVSSSQINLSWNASTYPDSAARVYTVYRTVTQIGTTSSTTYSATSLHDALPILDQVRIYNTALSASDVSSLYNSDNAPPADTTPPTVPTGLTTTPVSSSQINLSWNAS